MLINAKNLAELVNFIWVPRIFFLLGSILLKKVLYYVFGDGNWWQHALLINYFTWPINSIFLFSFRLCVILLYPCGYPRRHHSNTWWTPSKLRNCVPLQYCYSKLHTHKLCTQELASRLFPSVTIKSCGKRIQFCLNNVSFWKWLNVCSINNFLRFYIYLNKICGIGFNNVVNCYRCFYKWDTHINFILIQILICMRLI